MEKSESIKAIAKAIGKFQAEVDTVFKNNTGDAGSYKYKYADLAEILRVIREPLNKNGLSFSQFPTDEHSLTTILMHESGEFLQATYLMKPKKDDPQGLGSVITYQRRYALGAVLGLNIDEDDDASKASRPAAPVTDKKPAVNFDDRNLDAALKFIESAKTKADLVSCWNNNKELQVIKEFTAAMTARRIAISAPTVPDTVPDTFPGVKTISYEEGHAVAMVNAQTSMKGLNDLIQGEHREAVLKAAATKSPTLL